MSRETFLARVRAAAQTGQAYRVTPPDQTLAPWQSSTVVPELPERLAAEVDAVGGRAWLVDDLSSATERLNTLLAEFAPRSLLAWQHPLLERINLREQALRRGIEYHDAANLAPLSPADRRVATFAADVGVTSCTWAVADTGTLVMASAVGRERLASLLPPVHVALVTPDQILPDLFAVFERLSPAELASNVVCITGPSKTGDIELHLTTGVHGPGQWHVIIIRG